MIKVNPMIVMREELEGWGVLFDPDTGDTFGLNAISVFIWRGIEAGKSKEVIIGELAEVCANIPECVGEDFDKFVAELCGKGYVSCED